MADTAVERLTGQALADGAPVEVNLTIGVEHLLDPNDPTPADLPGWGPVPAGLADDIIGAAGARVAWRRLFTAPTGTKSGRIVMGGDPKARRFTGWLAKLVRLRDGQTCREPYVRREALVDRVEVRDLHRCPVAAGRS